MKTIAMENYRTIGIVGAGSWGTALAFPLEANGAQVTLWGHDAAHVAAMAEAKENAAYLPGVALPASVRCTNELSDLAACELVLIVTPSKAIREVSARLSTVGLRADTVLLSCTKGIERGSGKRMSEVIAEMLPGHVVSVLSGPSHAEEVARGMPTAVVLGCTREEAALRLQQTFSTACFRAYTNADVAGIEWGGALKNVFAIAAGVSDGLGLGDNSKAALVTRALAEMIRLGTALGGSLETFNGLGGIGDLIVTCFSRHSRNRRVGERLGKGERLADIVASMQMVAEGVPTTFGAREQAHKLGVEAPIIDEIGALLDDQRRPEQVLDNLLRRELKPE
ncbi:MAG: NAD(P)H-dependent glycerol-3-phosphate dehydrogenase [Chthoniobacteraceae bacterium]